MDDPTGNKGMDAGTHIIKSKDGGVTTNPAAPQITILSPKATTDPNKDTIVTEGMLTATCQVTRSKAAGSKDVNPGAVRMRAVGMDPKMQPTAVVSPGDANTYKGQFNLTAVPNGPLQIVCEADDTATPPLTGKATIDTMLDLGPEITIIEPADKSTHALKSPVLIKFTVSPNPVADNDKEAMPTDVTLDVLGQSVDFNEDKDQPGTYTTSVDFDDRTLFPMAPSTAVVTVTAKSSRTPDAPTRTVHSTIMLDAAGPKITVVSPTNRTIVRGEVVLKLTITDDSGVNRDTVVGKINNDLHILEPGDWTVNMDEFSQRFDTRPFGTELTELTINITAQDKVGNETTASTMLLLDNVPPLISLDPPYVRELKGKDPVICSAPFDPLGAATNDLDVRPESSLFRAFVDEQTNTSPGQVVGHVAGVKAGSVILFAGKAAVPILIDSDGDGVCDDINMKPDNADPPVQVTLSPLTVRGSAPYVKDGPSMRTDLNNAAMGCASGMEAFPPMLCTHSDMFRALPQTIQGQPPGVFALSPNDSDTVACEGNSWELIGALNDYEGWACVAARVEDTIGNIGVSRPLRICLDKNQNAPTHCGGKAPSCLDGCSPPPDFPSNIIYSFVNQ